MTIAAPFDLRCEEKISSVIPKRGLTYKHSVLPATFTLQCVNNVHGKTLTGSNNC